MLPFPGLYDIHGILSTGGKGESCGSSWWTSARPVHISDSPITSPACRLAWVFCRPFPFTLFRKQAHSEQTRDHQDYTGRSHCLPYPSMLLNNATSLGGPLATPMDDACFLCVRTRSGAKYEGNDCSSDLAGGQAVCLRLQPGLACACSRLYLQALRITSVQSGQACCAGAWQSVHASKIVVLPERPKLRFQRHIQSEAHQGPWQPRSMRWVTSSWPFF